MRYSREFTMGVCRPDLQILTRFQTWPLRNSVIITVMIRLPHSNKRLHSYMSDLVLLSAPNLIHYNIRERLTNGAWRNGCFHRLKNVLQMHGGDGHAWN